MNPASQLPNFGRIGVIGAGALGALYGARLARIGADVHLLARSDYEEARQQGYHIRSWQGDFRVHPPVYRTAADMGPCDLILIGMKATENRSLPALLAPTCHPQTLVLTMQNGLGNEEAIAAALATNFQITPEAAAGRVLGAVAFLCSTRVAPAVIHHTDHGRLRLAELSGPARPRTHQLAELFQRADFPCQVSDSLPLIRWEKLVWNVPFSGLGVAANANAEKVMRTPELRSAAATLMREVIAAANANGAPIHPSFEQAMFDATEPIGPYRSSMQIDFEEGRSIEREAILGEPLRRARAAGVPTPALELLHSIVLARTLK
jgi:2-dehydropantoate 2-reductase